MIKTSTLLVLIAVITVAGGNAAIFAAEQKEADVFATVVVNPIFNLSVDNTYISFGFLKPGESVELGTGTHHNFVTCTSNKGRRWYLKLYVMSEIAGPDSIPPSSFKWRVHRVQGDGVPADGWQPFGREPSVVYTSSTSASKGGESVIYLQYKLDLPQEAIAGIYSVNVMYTMTDIL